MVDRPRLKAHLSAHIVEPDELFLLGDDRQHLIESRAAVLIAPMLDGTRSVPEIAMSVGSQVPFAEVMGAIAALERGGHIAEGGGADPLAMAWWEADEADAEQVAAALDGLAVRVVVAGDLTGAETVAATLREAGIDVADAIEPIATASPGGDRLPVVLAEDYLSDGLEEWNEAALADGAPWLLARPVGETLWFGPYFDPAATGCWRCLSFRLIRNRHVEGYIQRRTGSRPSRPASTPPGAAAATGGVLAREIMGASVSGEAPTLTGRIVTMKRDLETLQHELIKRPQCPACGAGADAYGGPEIVLGDAPKRLTAGGAWRSMTAEETLERLEKHVSPITGAVAWVADLTEPGDSGHTFWAGHWFPVLGSERGSVVLRQNVRGRSGGKGSTKAQARTSAICESLERYSGCFFGDEPRERSTLEKLGDRAVEFSELPLYSDTQYEHRLEWNASIGSELQLVPMPLAADREIDFSTAWSMTKGEPRMVPTAYCYYGHPDIADFKTFFCAGDSNGQGAGNTLEEAITQGTMELVERDGVAIWWYNRLSLPAVDLDSFGNDWIDRVRSEYDAVGRDVWALDLTTDIGIPVFVAASRRRGPDPEDLIFGFGAHLEPRLAMERAFSELNQFLPAVRRDDNGNFMLDDPVAVEWWDTSTLASDPYLAPDPDAPARQLSDFRRLAGDDLAADIETCVRLFGDAGLETIVIDQSRPDIELHTAKVMVPGLRHFWRRLRPGRLYDVPVAMGRLDAPTPEADLNPKNIWF
jgi:bacteriocin biosynthesis cyclodehydratase domain-containing protein